MPEIREQVPLAPYTSLGLGGPARAFTTVTTIAEIQEALCWADAREIPVTVLGGGTNLVVSDEGFDGLVIAPRPAWCWRGWPARTPRRSLASTIWIEDTSRSR